ncbi:MAG: alpha/beta fold hydrolase [Micrococcaceae bacterium]
MVNLSRPGDICAGARVWMVSGTAGIAAELDPLSAALPTPATGPAQRWELPAVPSVAEAARLLGAALPPDEPVLLIGHSAGGIVAAQAALTRARTAPHTVAGLVLLDSNMPADPEAVRAKQRRFRDETGARTPRRAEFLESMAASIGPAPESVREQIMARMRAAADTSVRTDFWPDVLAQDTVALWRQLGSAGIPVLYLQATRAVSAAEVARLHPKAVVNTVVTPESTDPAGHWAHLTHPAEVARAITAWLG